jgi:hypothetical protein
MKKQLLICLLIIFAYSGYAQVNLTTEGRTPEELV